MSQKGGTYRRSSEPNITTQFTSSPPTRNHQDSKPKNEDPTSDKKPATDTIALRSDSLPQPQNQHDDKTDDQDWAVIDSPPDESNTHSGGGFSSHFDLQLGWGRWKFTLLSWDLNVRKEHTHGDGRGLGRAKSVIGEG
ncbi:hypothetical protein BU16DRAFT_615586 [Lophium mytilinum]|uniref:Uncharacterized protein n=1 Tax=Lophium mytilinum TaxID=390894 RepID=A0A6A6R222_9PEZI|nr:hypothetical protein BU16DRAFT_615586 [Lophium mytilinum]